MSRNTATTNAPPVQAGRDRGDVWWMAYLAVYSLGFAGLMYLTRLTPLGWAALALPFAFPVILLAIGARAAGADAGARQTSAALSPLGRLQIGIRRSLPRPTTLLAWTMIAPLFAWMFPADTGVPWIRLIFAGWWLACAAFAGLILPRLRTPLRTVADDDGLRG